MFSKTKAFSGFAAPDLEAARAFYADTLGIRTTEEHGLIEAAVDQLVERGVTFVRYDGMEQDERGIMLQERTD